MESSSKNPLSSYFRHAAIYLKLPSGGRWWGSGSLQLPDNQELAVFPMTAKDEIVLKTPDALMNGQGIVDVIQSCCPAIKNAWDMPSVDVDAVLISIRIASYGNMMTFDSSCPHCTARNSHEVALDGVLSEVRCPGYDQQIAYRDLKIQLRPQPYFQVNRSNIIQFEEAKILNTLNDTTIDPEEKAKLISISVQKLADAGIDMCAYATEYIELPDGSKVTAIEHIKDFYHNAEKDLINHFQETFNVFNEQTKIKPRMLQCEECSKEYQVEVNFDYSNFFGKGF